MTWTAAGALAVGGLSYWYLRGGKAKVPVKVANGAPPKGKGAVTIETALVRPEDLKGEIRIAKLLIHPIKVRLKVFCVTGGNSCSYTLWVRAAEGHPCRRQNTHLWDSRYVLLSSRCITSLRSETQGDRRWCIIDAHTHKILTARQFPKVRAF